MENWGIEKGAWKDNYPIGLDAEEFILDNAQWVLYMRRDPRFVCTKHHSQSQSAPLFVQDPCTVCYGFGVKVDPIIVPCRITLKEPQVTFRETDQRAPNGWLEYYTAAADFPRSVKPSLEDHILVCEWDKPAQQLGKYPRAKAITIHNIYAIKQLNDYFEREISHFGVGLEAQNHDLDRYMHHLPVMKNIPIMQFRPDNPSYWGARSFW